VVVGNDEVVSQLHRLKVNIDSGQFLPVMEAAAAALNSDQAWLAERNLVYQQRRDIVLNYLDQMGLAPRVPRASLYVWSPIPPGRKAREFAAELLEKTGISLTPGDIFGPHGEGYIRISVTVPQARIEEAMQRMMKFVQEGGG
jgi:LL-diaminopimelate aminotransferase